MLQLDFCASSCAAAGECWTGLLKQLLEVQGVCLDAIGGGQLLGRLRSLHVAALDIVFRGCLAR